MMDVEEPGGGEVGGGLDRPMDETKMMWYVWAGKKKPA
jgi:hypothetical protein